MGFIEERTFLTNKLLVYLIYAEDGEKRKINSKRMSINELIMENVDPLMQRIII